MEMFRMERMQGAADPEAPPDRVYSETPAINYSTTFKFTFKAK